jgi:hypothetical protein
MEPFRVSIDKQKLSKEISCLEYPEFADNFEDFNQKLKVNLLLCTMLFQSDFSLLMVKNSLTVPFQKVLAVSVLIQTSKKEIALY